MVGREGGREGEGGRAGWREEGRTGWRDGKREGGWKRWCYGGREG